MRALVYKRKPVRFAAAIAAGRLAPGAGAGVGPLSHDDIDPPDLPGPDWVRLAPRLAGICGSDLATIDGQSSRWFEPVVSFPFVPGHEVVADVVGDDNPDGTATRVVLEPVLGCVTRGITPVCAPCAAGDLGNCTNITFGAIAPGLQSGFCCDTGGGWSAQMVAHRSQLHPVPDTMDDHAAVMVEPAACAVHATLAAGIEPGATVVVQGAGTLGLLCIAAVRRFTDAGTVIAVAKHPVQRDWARDLGADMVVDPDEVARAVRRATGTMAIGDGHITRLAGGADAVLDCVGSSDSLTTALSVVRPRGQITVVGMAGATRLDLTGLWQREIRMVGAYAYGTETLTDGTSARTFDLAFDLVAAADLGRLVSATYPLASYRDAIAHAASAGSRGAVKVAFDLRRPADRTAIARSTPTSASAATPASTQPGAH
jgi:threonine dehydrogenase-like Zn-dependent dehydrogenase